MKAQILLLMFLTHEAIRTSSRTSKALDTKRPQLKAERKLWLISNASFWWNMLSFVIGLLVGTVLSFFMTSLIFGVFTKKSSIDKLRKGTKKRMLFEAYGKAKGIVKKAASQRKNLEEIIRDEKMWRELTEHNKIFKPALRVANTISLYSLPKKLEGRKLHFKIVRKLNTGLKKVVDDPRYECMGRVCFRYFLNALGIGIIIGLVGALIYNSYLDELLLDEAKKKEKSSRKLKEGLRVMGPLAPLFRDLHQYSSKLASSNSSPTTPIKTVLGFLTSRSLKQKKNIAEGLKKIVDALPPKVKSLFLPHKII